MTGTQPGLFDPPTGVTIDAATVKIGDVFNNTPAKLRFAADYSLTPTGYGPKVRLPCVTCYHIVGWHTIRGDRIVDADSHTTSIAGWLRGDGIHPDNLAKPVWQIADCDYPA